jgi:diguanylate cyclase (GGDEF)-like protein/PAS domain S-box-containing protein
VVDASHEACRELDRDRHELLGAGFADSLVPADGKALTAVLADLAGSAGDEAEPTRLSVQRPNGEVAVDSLDLRLLACGAGLVRADVRSMTEQARLEHVLGALATSTFVADAYSQVTWRLLVDDWARSLAAADAADGTGLNWVHPDDLPMLLEAYTRLLDNADSTEVVQVRTRIPHLDNSWARARLTAVNKLGDPLIAGLVVRSERQSKLDQVDSIGETSGVFRSLAETAPMGIVVTDRDGRPFYFNSLARELFGQDDVQADDVDWTHRVRAEHRVALAVVVVDALERQQAGSLVVALDLPEERTVWCRLDVHPEIDEDGNPFGLIATLQDVTAETEARQALLDARDELWTLANHDALTGLPNRAFLMDRLERATARRKRTGTSVAVLYCDLDGFKAVNDSLGHLAGDAVLVEASRRMMTVVRETDTIGRLGGDEFLVICEGFTSVGQIQTVAERIVAALAAPMTVAGTAVEVGASIGIAVNAGPAPGDPAPGDPAPGDPATGDPATGDPAPGDPAPGEPTAGDPATGDSATDDLIRRADHAMYQAKTAGKGSFQFAG